MIYMFEPIRHSTLAHTSAATPVFRFLVLPRYGFEQQSRTQGTYQQSASERGSKWGVATGMRASRCSKCELGTLPWTLHRIALGLLSEGEWLQIQTKRIVRPRWRCVIGFCECALLRASIVVALLDGLWFIEGHKYCTRDWDMKCRRRATPIIPAFVGCPNGEVFALRQAMRQKH